MRKQINKTTTAAQVISLCDRRKTRLHTDRKGGYTEQPRAKAGRHDQPTPPTAA